MKQSQFISQFILEALGIASQIALQHFRQPVNVDLKPDDSPVTQADRDIEQAIRDLLGERFPSHGIYGEEQGRSSGQGGVWVIDPIDGIKSFLLGNPLFGCLLGFVEDGIVKAGGWADLVVESGLYPFDYLPLVPIVEQAGGVISDWQGNPLGLDSGPQVIVAATPQLHEAALRALGLE